MEAMIDRICLPRMDTPTPSASGAAPGAGTEPSAAAASGNDPILCGHCGRTASNGITCQGMCVADSGY
jgi:hypothetical protein